MRARLQLTAAGKEKNYWCMTNYHTTVNAKRKYPSLSSWWTSLVSITKITVRRALHGAILSAHTRHGCVPRCDRLETSDGILTASNSSVRSIFRRRHSFSTATCEKRLRTKWGVCSNEWNAITLIHGWHATEMWWLHVENIYQSRIPAIFFRIIRVLRSKHEEVDRCRWSCSLLLQLLVGTTCIRHHVSTRRTDDQQAKLSARNRCIQ